MKIVRLFVLPALMVSLCLAVTHAAPIESVESAVAKPALQKVDLFLGEQAVAARLTTLGISANQVHARLTKLNDAQLAQLATEVDKLQAGGDIQSGNPHPLGPIGCVFKRIGDTIVHFFKVLFCWTDVE